jgi:hypothetical protein
MSMRAERENEMSARDLFQQPILGDISVQADDPLLLTVQERDFRWFLQ